MRRKYATNGLTVKASCVLPGTGDVLSDLEYGAAMCTVGAYARRVAL